MKTESHGETKRDDPMTDLLRLASPCLSEQELDRQTSCFLQQEVNEMRWAGATDSEVGMFATIILTFIDYLKENFYGSRN